MKSGDSRPAFYGGLKFMVSPGVYEPAEDTFLIADNLDVKAGEDVLEIGTGCGILAVLAAKAGAKVIATDINPEAVDCAEENARMNGVGGKIDFRLGSLFEPVAGKTFDLVVFNPPYLPASGGLEGDPVGLACEGGRDGRDFSFSEVSLQTPEKRRKVHFLAFISFAERGMPEIPARARVRTRFENGEAEFRRTYLGPGQKGKMSFLIQRFSNK